MASTEKIEKIAPGFDLMQPEILSVPVIAQHLQKKIVGEKDFDSLSKDDLLELYYSFVLPFPQRQYRGNRRGQILTLKQRSIDKLKNRNIAQENILLENARRRNEGKVPLTMDTSDRLKPPPNFGMGRRALGSVKRKAETSLDDIVIECKPRKNDGIVPLPKPKKDKVTLAKLVKPKTSLDNVIVKNNSNSVSDSNSSSDSDSKSKSESGIQKIVSVKPSPPKPKLDPLSHVVIKEFTKKDKSIVIVHSEPPTKKRTSITPLNSNKPKVSKTVTFSHDISVEKMNCVTVPPKNASEVTPESTPSERKRVKLKRPST